MISQSSYPRPRLSFSPLMIISLIFVAVLVIEALLAARFWLQLYSPGWATTALVIPRPPFCKQSQAPAPLRSEVANMPMCCSAKPVIVTSATSFNNGHA